MHSIIINLAKIKIKRLQYFHQVIKQIIKKKEI